MGRPVVSVAPIPTSDTLPYPCPARTCGKDCHACLGHRRVHLTTELQGPSAKRVLADLVVLADRWGETAPGAYLWPDGAVVYGIKTSRRVVDQPGYQAPRRLRVVKP